MGWDAFALSPETSDWVAAANQKTKELEIVDEKTTVAFAAAVLRVVGKAGGVDADLKIGGLGCRSCAEMFEQAGASPYSDWDAEKVKDIARTANWDFDPGEDAWAYWSAREFLQTCADLGLAVRFSY